MELHSISDYKLLWVVGAAERLATLGLIGKDVPYTISSDTVDEYLKIDNRRHDVFESDFEIAQIFHTLVRVNANEDDIDDENVEDIIDLLIDYKNQRTDLVKYALCNSEVFS